MTSAAAQQSVEQQNSTLPFLTKERLERVKQFYNRHADDPNWAARRYRQVLAHYYNLLIAAGASVLEVGCGDGTLLSLLKTRNVTGVDISDRQIAAAQSRVPYGSFSVQAGEELNLDGEFDYIVVSDTLNLAADVQVFLHRLLSVANGHTRLLINAHSALWRPVFALATAAGAKSPQPESNWLGTRDLLHLLELAGWEAVSKQERILSPTGARGLGFRINRYLAPLLPWFCLSVFVVAKRRAAPIRNAISVSIVVPARNEAGNIEDAIRRLPSLGRSAEIIFVEGGSSDHTWTEMQRVAKAYPHLPINVLRQTGTGKANAVREGFAAARGEILMILDADLTVPPEDLAKFYELLASGHAEFGNGVRLVYPMEEEAMQFLNLCANKFFSVAFSWLLGQPVKDTLCGTKALFRSDYERIEKNRAYFGDFDPFGDFDLLFGASHLQLKIRDVPIRYGSRNYGKTNIHRWRHGLVLLRMLLFAARKIKFV